MTKLFVTLELLSHTARHWLRAAMAAGAMGVLAVLTSCAQVAGAAQQDWGHPRGPFYTGVAGPDFRMPAELQPTVLWRTAIGEGFSGCTVSGRRLFTQAQTPAGQFVIALDAGTGQELWRRRIEWPWELGKHYPGPFATPVIHAGRVFYTGAYGSLGCLDAGSGRTVWKVDLASEHGVERPGFGYACTPLCLDDSVFVFGGERGPSLLAFDARTGQPRWQTGVEGSSYSSPLPIRMGNMTQVAVFHQNAVAAYDPATGAELWRHAWSRGYDPHPAWMLYEEPHLFCAAPFRRGSAVLQPVLSDMVWRVNEVWRSRVMSQDILSGALFEGHVYGFDLRSAQASLGLDTRGSLSCLDVARGAVLWSVENTGHASVIVADRQLVIVNERGELIVAEAQPGAYRERARIDVLPDERCWSPSAAAAGRVYIRGEQTVACVAFDGTPPLASTTGAQASPRQPASDAAAYVEPRLADLLRWGVAGLAIVLAASSAAAVAPVGGGVRRGSVLFLAAAVLAGALPALWRTPMFTWPAVLYAGLMLTLVVSRSARSPLASRLMLTLFAGLCLACYGACRDRSIAVAPGFMVGFVAALPFAMPAAARYASGNSQRHAVMWSSAGFAAYYLACSAFVLWRLR